jgi:hypothetical protein
MLLEVDAEAMNSLARKPPRLIIFSLLILTDTHRIPLDIHVCSASPMSVIYLELLLLFRPTTWLVHQFPSGSYVFPETCCDIAVTYRYVADKMPSVGWYF